MKTIKQIADEIGVSKQAVQKRIAREPLCTSLSMYIDKKGNTIYIQGKGETLIKEAFLKNKRVQVADNQSATIDMDTYTKEDTLLDVLKATIDTLQNQLDKKDEQLATKDRQIEELISITREQAQSINIDRHGEFAEKLIEGQKMIDIDSSIKNETKEKNPSFWKRVFGKKE